MGVFLEIGGYYLAGNGNDVTEKFPFYFVLCENVLYFWKRSN